MENSSTLVWIKSSLINVDAKESLDKIGRPAGLNGMSSDAKRSTSLEVQYQWILGSMSSNYENIDKKHDRNAENVTIKILDENSPQYYGKEVTFPLSELDNNEDLLMVNIEDHIPNQIPPHDLTQLTHLHEPAVVNCLQKRYENDLIYTATGPILLAVNPFKKCPKLYDRAAIKKYRKARRSSSSYNSLPPHVFGIADNAFHAMIQDLELLRDQKGVKNDDRIKVNQSILVSGESGAGKTVSTKHIMRYLANLSLNSDNEEKKHFTAKSSPTIYQVKPDASSQSGIEAKILESNPILESFGNARTIRNDNSSRFGKFIELQFVPTNNRSATLIGAKIETYLLEKVRLVNQGPGERNFHIFYEVLDGIEDEGERKDLFLDNRDMNDFRITSMSGTFGRRDQIDDYETYDGMRNAMSTLGFESKEQIDIMRIISAILHASNITFTSISADECKINQDNASFQPFLLLMGLTSDMVNETICYVHVHARGETYKRTLSKEKARKGLEALVKFTYGALFNHIVALINKEISTCSSATKSSDYSKANRGVRAKRMSQKIDVYSIGVLDIFGFETFEKNSFEQLCINYCNEALQNQFNAFIFTNEQQEYEREGIAWDFIDFPDNRDVLQLIDQIIIPILDDQCRTPKGCDDKFAKHVFESVKDHSRFSANHIQKACNHFSIIHYAGKVQYDTTGFIEKNKDEIPKESADLLKSSSISFVKKLAETSLEQNTTPTKGRRNKLTVGGQFILQLRSLRERIGMTHPHYVRCLKPNSDLVCGAFDQAMIANQLRHAGVLEAVRVTRVGFPQRFAHTQFLRRYFSLCSKEVKNSRINSNRASCESLINALIPQIESYSVERGNKYQSEKKGVGIEIGNTKVFLRGKAFEHLERLRERRMLISSIKIQAHVRSFCAQISYLKLIQATISIQKYLRMSNAKTKVRKIRENLSVTVIQKYYRMSNERKLYIRRKYIAIWGQRMLRGYYGRKKYVSLNKIKQVTIIQKYWRMNKMIYQFNAAKKAILTIQCAVRVRISRLCIQKRRADAKNLKKIIEERDYLKHQNRKLMEELEKMRKKLRDNPKSKNYSINNMKMNPATERHPLRQIHTEMQYATLESTNMKENVHNHNGYTHQKLCTNPEMKKKGETIQTRSMISMRTFHDSKISPTIGKTHEDEILPNFAVSQKRMHCRTKNRQQVHERSGRRWPIRVGKSKILRESKIRARTNDRTISSRIGKRGSVNEEHTERILLSRMITLLDSMNSDGNVELEKLKKDTEQLKANVKSLRKKVKTQKTENASNTNPPVVSRVPVMSCAIGPSISSMFAKAEDSRSLTEDRNCDVPCDAKNGRKFTWW